MTDSMTAFSRTESASGRGELSWEVRTVNHRYLEMMFRIPDELRRFEPGFRRRVSSQLSRGRVDANLRLRADDGLHEDVDVDMQTVDRLGTLSESIREKLPDATGLRVIDVLNWPGVVESPEADIDELGKLAETLLEQALDEITTTRRQEGAKLEELISQRLTNAQEIVKSLTPVAAEFEERFRARLEEKLQAVSVSVNPERLEQEVVLYLQKADIDEELDRLHLHLNEVSNVLQNKKPVGRRLDFLMQELNREANTLGSKAQDNQVTRAAVDLKVLIEQMREQVQNIE